MTKVSGPHHESYLARVSAAGWKSKGGEFVTRLVVVVVDEFGGPSRLRDPSFPGVQGSQNSGSDAPGKLLDHF
jgi:hypothetical protein